jgi:hypothetical protein
VVNTSRLFREPSLFSPPTLAHSDHARMKSYTAAAVAASLAGVVSARVCQNVTVPVTITARNGVFDQEALTPRNNIDVTNIILAGTQQGHNATAEALKGYADVSGTYNLETTYCEPDSGSPDVVQILTHGIGFDRSYWDLPYSMMEIFNSVALCCMLTSIRWLQLLLRRSCRR